MQRNFEITSFFQQRIPSISTQLEVLNKEERYKISLRKNVLSRKGFRSGWIGLLARFRSTVKGIFSFQIAVSYHLIIKSRMWDSGAPKDTRWNRVCEHGGKMKCVVHVQISRKHNLRSFMHTGFNFASFSRCNTNISLSHNCTHFPYSHYTRVSAPKQTWSMFTFVWLFTYHYYNI